MVDRVIPHQRVRQWVSSFPWALRILFAARPVALSRCLAMITRAIETDPIRRAGLTRARAARSGIVTLIQRGYSRNLSVHLHMLVLDGVYEPVGKCVRCRRVPAPNSTQLAKLLGTIIARTGPSLHHAPGLPAQRQSAPNPSTSIA